MLREEKSSFMFDGEGGRQRPSAGFEVQARQGEDLMKWGPTLSPAIFNTDGPLTSRESNKMLQSDGKL